MNNSDLTIVFSVDQSHGGCSGAWGFYIDESLRKLIETGKGDPNKKEKRRPARDVGLTTE